MHSRFFNVAHDMMCTASTEGWFIEVNPAWSRALGWTADDLTGRPFVEFVHPDDQARTNDEAAHLATGTDTVDFRNRYRTKTGEYRWIDWRAVLDHEAGVIYAAARDVTDSVELQEAMAAREELLTWMVREQLRARDDEHRRLSGELHDSAVQHCVAALMLAEQVETTLPDDADREAFEVLRAEVARALQATRSVMHGLDPFDFGELTLLQSLELLRDETQVRYGTPVRLDVAADLAEALSGDLAANAYRMVSEAVTNAGKHAQATAIDARLERDGDELVLVVADDGRGMDATAAGGSPNSATGLGLTFLRERVHALDGVIDLASGVGGTRIEIRVPLSAHDAALEPQAEQRAS